MKIIVDNGATEVEVVKAVYMEISKPAALRKTPLILLLMRDSVSISLARLLADLSTPRLYASITQ